MRKIQIACFLAMGLALYACGGGSSSSNATDENNKIVSNSSSPIESITKSNSIDVDKYSNSKGIGQFKDMKVDKTIDAAMATKGKEVFQTKCMVCHQATDQKLIGPGLKGITKIRTPEWIMNMITNPDKMTQEDPVAKALLAQYNNTQMTNQGVTKEEARQLYEFFRQNDTN